MTEKAVSWFDVRLEVDVEAWAVDNGVDRTTALQQIAQDGPEWMADALDRLNRLPKWRDGVGTWSAGRPGPTVAQLKEAIRAGMLAGALAKFGGPAEQYGPVHDEHLTAIANRVLALFEGQITGTTDSSVG